MLLNDFYTIENWSASPTTAGEIRAVLSLNANHPIFAAHFPGQPVVPGACQLQMAEELLSHVLDTECRLANASQIKFLTPIDPRLNSRIEAVLRYSPQGIESSRPTRTHGAASHGPVPASEAGSMASVPAPAESPRSVPAQGADPNGPIPALEAGSIPSSPAAAEWQVTVTFCAAATTFLKLSGIFRAG